MLGEGDKKGPSYQSAGTATISYLCDLLNKTESYLNMFAEYAKIIKKA